LLDIDGLLDDDERDIAATVRKFVDTRLRTNIEGWFESATLPKELAKELGDLGVLGMHLDGYGCAATNAVSYGLTCLELEAGESGFRSFVSVQGSLSMFSIYRYGSEEQKNEWLPKLAAGEAIGCFGLTEPDFGSNPAGMRTRARRDGTDWVRAGEQILVTRKPVGVVGVITPFNFPIAIPAWKIAPALVYGNSVVWNPASAVPLLAMRLAHALTDAGLPAGGLNLVIGGSFLGDSLVDHREVDAVTFTGSTGVGRRIAAAAAARGVPVQAEMGGKNAAIVLDDADIELALEQVMFGAFRSTGQKCTATSRLIVTDGIAERLLSALRTRADAIVVGDPTHDCTEMGPVVSDSAHQAITLGIETATAQGATLLAGGRPYTEAPLSDGYFIAPTIVELDSQPANVSGPQSRCPRRNTRRGPEDPRRGLPVRDTHSGGRAGGPDQQHRRGVHFRRTARPYRVGARTGKPHTTSRQSHFVVGNSRHLPQCATDSRRRSPA
jgi:Aldehyde dehydrogenase family/Acyl-CoA dehydrogenase, N-terminal domain